MKKQKKLLEVCETETSHLALQSEAGQRFVGCWVAESSKGAVGEWVGGFEKAQFLLF